MYQEELDQDKMGQVEMHQHHQALSDVVLTLPDFNIAQNSPQHPFNVNPFEPPPLINFVDWDPYIPEPMCASIFYESFIPTLPPSPTPELNQPQSPYSDYPSTDESINPSVFPDYAYYNPVTDTKYFQKNSSTACQPIAALVTITSAPTPPLSANVDQPKEIKCQKNMQLSQQYFLKLNRTSYLLIDPMIILYI